MPSTYTNNLGIEKPATGEQSGTWGDTVNDNSDIIDRAVNGVGTITLSSTTYTLSTLSGDPTSEGIYKVLKFAGTPGGACTVTISPNTAQKLYFVENGCGEDVIMRQGNGSTVTIPDGQTAIVYANGVGSSSSVFDINSLSDLGVTASTSELNILDGATVSTAELNILTGTTVTTNQLNNWSQVTSTPAEINILDGATITTAELNILDGVTADANEINILDGATITTAELNYLDVTTLGTSEASKAVTADGSNDVIFGNDVTVTNDLSVLNSMISKQYVETNGTETLASGTLTFDCSTGNVFKYLMSSSFTVAFSNVPSSGSYGIVIQIQHSGTHSDTITWPASVYWPNSIAPSVSSGKSFTTTYDVFVLFTDDGGTSWRGFLSGSAMEN